MKLPVLTSVIVFIIILALCIKRSDKKMEEENKSFWERENNANFVRRKPLDDLAYLTIPKHFLSLPADLNDDRVRDALDMLTYLSGKKIVNLTGITNTDLKLTYGTANLSVLTEYDQNYTQLAHALQLLADSLFKQSHFSEAKEVLEYAISTKTDISASYLLLADLYLQEGRPEKINELIEKASTLNSLLVSSIIRNLEKKIDSNAHTPE